MNTDREKCKSEAEFHIFAMWETRDFESSTPKPFHVTALLEFRVFSSPEEGRISTAFPEANFDGGGLNQLEASSRSLYPSATQS